MRKILFSFLSVCRYACANWQERVVEQNKTTSKKLGSLPSYNMFLLHGAELQRNLDLYIPRKGIARHQPQYPHSCVCEPSILGIFVSNFRHCVFAVWVRCALALSDYYSKCTPNVQNYTFPELDRKILLSVELSLFCQNFAEIRLPSLANLHAIWYLRYRKIPSIFSISLP
jgi:hypothetical protein